MISNTQLKKTFNIILYSMEQPVILNTRTLVQRRKLNIIFFLKSPEDEAQELPGPRSDSPPTPHQAISTAEGLRPRQCLTLFLRFLNRFQK